MGKLTGTQKINIIGGQAIRMVYSAIVPTSIAHTAYTTDIFDDGIFEGKHDGLRYVTDPGSRSFEVWNPSPMVQSRPKAVRYEFECHNRDGFFHPGSGNLWNPNGTYEAAPQECFIKHQIYIYDPASGWDEITHMSYTGKIIGLSVVDGADATGASVPDMINIQTEQVGAWDVLRRTFTRDDGEIGLVNDTAGNGIFTWTKT